MCQAGRLNSAHSAEQLSPTHNIIRLADHENFIIYKYISYCAAKLPSSIAAMKNLGPPDAAAVDLVTSTTVTPSGPRSVGISTVSRSTPPGVVLLE